MSMIDKKLKDFKVTAFVNDTFKEVTHHNLIGSWSVLFFYPADFTFICPTELGDLADMYDDFKNTGCEIYSISTDTHFTHKAWYDASQTIQKIKYPMLADPTHQLANDFDVLIPDEGITHRATFIINPEGKIVAYEISNNAIGRSSKELLRKVQAAQFTFAHSDQVCPANWTPGSTTLTPGLDLIGKL